MHTQPLHLQAGSDVRRSLEELAREQGVAGFVLAVVGNLSQACFQCPGRARPTQLRGELEIITLSGTLAPQGVHLHLSLSDGDCRVWGGHLEPGTLVLRGADLLVGWLAAPQTGPQDAPDRGQAVVAPLPAAVAPPPPAAGRDGEPRVQIAVSPDCPYSARALRMLRTLAIPHRIQMVEGEQQRHQLRQRSGSGSLPQVFIDGVPIGGYDALAERHGRGELETLRDG